MDRSLFCVLGLLWSAVAWAGEPVFGPVKGDGGIQLADLRGGSRVDGPQGVSTTVATSAVATDGWTTLFDGTNLEAWQMGPDKSWVIEDGLIALHRAEFDGREHNSDYLWTKEQYGDFVLELEFKVPERANSGVFLRTADLKDPVYTGIEVQVSNSHGRPDLSRGGTAGAIYDCLAPTKNAAKPAGQWNQLRVTCQDSKIAVVLNGEAVIDMDLNQWTEPSQNPDGTKNKFPRAMKDFARKGHLGLQDHGRPVWYRNVRIKSLKETDVIRVDREGVSFGDS